MVVILLTIVFILSVFYAEVRMVINDANEIIQSMVYITGYHQDGDDGRVECKTLKGYDVSLIDIGCAHQNQCICQNNNSAVRILFHINIRWAIFLRINLYIDGIVSSGVCNNF